MCGQDYLTAPMPFLIGLQASLLPSLKRLPMDEVTLVDLDMGTCEPSPGSLRDDARLLPWSDRLQAALQVCSALFAAHLAHNCADLPFMMSADSLLTLDW